MVVNTLCEAWPKSGANLLVGLVSTVRIADLSLEIARLVLDEILRKRQQDEHHGGEQRHEKKGASTYADTTEVGPLGVSVDVHLDDAVLDGSLDLVLGRAGAAVEDEEEGLLVSIGELLLCVELVPVEELGVKTDVSGLVNTVDVAEGGGDGEVGADLGESSVDVPDVLRLCVETGVVYVGVVYAVLLTASDADLHLEPETERGHALEVLDASVDVVLLGFFGEIEHVRREERLIVLFEIVLVCVEHAIEPGEKLFGAVIRVENDGASRGEKRSERGGTGEIEGGREACDMSGSGTEEEQAKDAHAVFLCYGPDVVSGGHGTCDGGLLVVVGEALSCEEGGAALGDLEDDGGLDVAKEGLGELGVGENGG